jgi:hypothetical protein
VQVKGTWAPPIGAAIGLVIATLAGLVSLRTGVTGVVIVHDQVVGMAYLVAGVIAWRRRPDNATGPLLVAIGYSWYIPVFQAAPVPLVAGLAFATRRLINALSSYLLLAFPSGRLGLRRHRIAMGLVIAVTAIQMPPRLLLMDRIPASSSMPIGAVTVGCDCVNPFAVASAPGLLARIESLTGFLTVASRSDHHGSRDPAPDRGNRTDASRPLAGSPGAVVALGVFAFNVLSHTLGTSARLWLR